MKNGKFGARDALFQAFIKQGQLDGNELDPFVADGKARGYLTRNAPTLKASNIGMENFWSHRSYAMTYRELSGLFLQLFDWFRNLYSIISEHAMLPSSEILLALKAHLISIRCQLTPSIVMCILNVPLATATEILPQYLEDSVSSAKKARCMFERGDRRCKITVILDEDFGKASCKVYCRHHSTDN